MDNWENDDEAMNNCYDAYVLSRNCLQHNDDKAGFVPYTHVYLVLRTFRSKPKSLNARLRTAVGNQRPGKQIVYKGQVLEPLCPVGTTLPGGAYPLCLCGDEPVVVVAKTEKKAGRRFFGV